jgi:endonuclease YncB( thermonuclease family)
LAGDAKSSTDLPRSDRLRAMKDQDRPNLATYRSAKNRQQRTAALERWKPSATMMAWAALLAFAAVTFFAFGTSNNRFSTADLTGTIAGSGGISECGLIRRTCLVDGDTGWQDGTKWRMQGIDAPEKDNKAECESERVKAQASLQRLAELMAPGYMIKGSGKDDRFARALVDVVLNDGRDAGKVLIAEGLAQPWPNSGNVWCGRR